MLHMYSGAIIFYTLTLKSKWKMIGFVYIQNSQYSPKFWVYSLKFLGFFPAFKNLWVFATLVLMSYLLKIYIIIFISIITLFLLEFVYEFH